MSNKRSDIVNSLIQLSMPLSVLNEKLSSFPWDYDGDIVILKWHHCVSVLERYLRGELDKQQVETWANLIEGRDDIDFDISKEERIRECIYELANPVLTKPLTRDGATEMLTKV